MPGEGSRVNGTYKADATPGGKLLARELDRMATENGVHSLHAKVKYLTGTIGGQEAMVEAGINLANGSTRDTVLRWLGDDHIAPGIGISHANARRVDEAYAARRRETTARNVRRRLERGGGAWVEVSPPDQSRVERRHRRNLEQLLRDAGKEPRIRILDDTWDDLVDAWEAGDDASMQRDWESVCDDQLYPPAAFYSCGDLRVAA